MEGARRKGKKRMESLFNEHGVLLWKGENAVQMNSDGDSPMTCGCA